MKRPSGIRAVIADKGRAAARIQAVGCDKPVRREEPLFRPVESHPRLPVRPFEAGRHDGSRPISVAAPGGRRRQVRAQNPIPFQSASGLKYGGLVIKIGTIAADHRERRVEVRAKLSQGAGRIILAAIRSRRAEHAELQSPHAPEGLCSQIKVRDSASVEVGAVSEERGTFLKKGAVVAPKLLVVIEGEAQHLVFDLAEVRVHRKHAAQIVGEIVPRIETRGRRHFLNAASFVREVAPPRGIRHHREFLPAGFSR